MGDIAQELVQKDISQGVSVDVYYCSTLRGTDAVGRGSLNKPFKTVQYAIDTGAAAGTKTEIFFDNSIVGENVDIPANETIIIRSNSADSTIGGHLGTVTLFDSSILILHNVYVTNFAEDGTCTTALVSSFGAFLDGNIPAMPDTQFRLKPLIVPSATVWETLIANSKVLTSGTGVDVNGVVYATGGFDAGSDIDMNSNNINEVKTLDFTPQPSLPSHNEGTMFYDDDLKVFTLYNDQSDVALQIGEEQWVRGKNNEASPITDGEVVYIEDVEIGPPVLPLFKLGQALTGVAGKTFAMVTQSSIAANAVGIFTTFGTVRGLDTTATGLEPGAETWVKGDELWLSTTVAGGLTNVKPTSTGERVVRIGWLFRSHATEGQIFVNIKAVPAAAGVLIDDSAGYYAADNVEAALAEAHDYTDPHKGTHDPEDGSDKLDTAAPGSIDETANATGTAHSFARSDHNHQHTAALHENGGGAEISVAALSGLLADDQHVLDTEVRAAIGDLLDSVGKALKDLDMDSNDILNAGDIEADSVTGTATDAKVESTTGDVILKSSTNDGSSSVVFQDSDGNSVGEVDSNGKFIISGSTEQGAVGEEMAVAEYLGDSAATKVLVKLLGILPTGQDYAEIMGGEDGSGQFGKGFIIKHNKAGSKYEIYYSTSGKWDGTEVLLFDISSTGALTVTGKGTMAGVDSSEDITLTDPGTTVDSKKIIMQGDNIGTTQIGSIKVAHGANPYVQIAVPQAAGGAETPALDISETGINPSGSKDIGTSGNKWVNLFLSGIANLTHLVVAGSIIRNTTVVNVATYDLTPSDDILLVTYTITGAVTSLTLPDAADVDGRVIVIKDAGMNANTFNITIDTESGQLIDLAANLVMNSDGESVTLVSDGTNWWVI